MSRETASQADLPPIGGWLFTPIAQASGPQAVLMVDSSGQVAGVIQGTPVQGSPSNPNTPSTPTTQQV